MKSHGPPPMNTYHVMWTFVRTMFALQITKSPDSYRMLGRLGELEAYEARVRAT